MQDHAPDVEDDLYRTLRRKIIGVPCHLTTRSFQFSF
jgi:hypothetical protein